MKETRFDTGFFILPYIFMIKTIAKSSNKKLGGCAATYRSGLGDVYSTCPTSCVLKPATSAGSQTIDRTYLNAVLEAVPRQGSSWTYTHFPREVIPRSNEGQTCINISTDTIQQAIDSIGAGYPTVVVRPSSEQAKVDIHQGIRFVRCPAEYSEITCNSCGGQTGQPLCARPDRNYVIKFTAHGSQAKKIDVRSVDISASSGGCYGNGGPVRLQWEKTKGETGDDAEILRQFVAGLPVGTKLRHHVVGDLG